MTKVMTADRFDLKRNVGKNGSAVLASPGSSARVETTVASPVEPFQKYRGGA